MAHKVEFSNPDFPKDVEFDIGGILVPNGGSVEVSEEQEADFEARHGSSLKDHFKGSDTVKVSGSAGSTNSPKGGDS